MMKKFIFFCLMLLLFSDAHSQLEDGSIAPNFNAIDLQGNSWNLYSILNEGKTVVIQVFATWDDLSWDYLQSGELQTFNDTYGPAGSNEVVVLSIEGEPSNHAAQLFGPQFLSSEDSTKTWGDWISGNSVPVIDSAAIANELDINYFPTVYIICPDRVVNQSSQMSAVQLYDAVQNSSCPQISEGLDPAVLNPIVTRVCGSDVVDFSFVLKNLGTENLNQVDYQAFGVQGEPIFTWIGSLEPYLSDTITLVGLQLLNESPVTVAINSENVNTLNDTVSARSSVGLSTLRIQLELGLDNYPSEVSWDIRNSNNDVVFSDGDFSVPYEYFNTFFDLPAMDCYTFFLYDSEGDGLHGSQWGGFDGSCYLRSIDANGNVTSVLYSYDGSTNFSTTLNTPSFQSVQFYTGAPITVPELEGIQSLRVYPSPSTGEFTCTMISSGVSNGRLDLFDATGRLVKSIPTGQIAAGANLIPINISEMQNGVYFLKLNSGKQIIQQKVILTK